jgi:hypothetical protein
LTKSSKRNSIYHSKIISLISKEKHIQSFIKEIQKFKVDVLRNGNRLNFSHAQHQIEFIIADESFDFTTKTKAAILPLDCLISSPEKMLGIILSQLQLNKKIFARKCEIKKIDRTTAEKFLNQYHLMNATSSGFNVGVFYQDELMCVASFSKGRKMNRLAAHERSYELIRFCTKFGYTVTGGLSKLLKYFYDEKKAGDIMTYLDKQFSNGQSFINAGFKKHSDMEPNFFLINKKTFERTLFSNQIFDSKEFYLSQNEGSMKLIYKPKSKS